MSSPSRPPLDRRPGDGTVDELAEELGGLGVRVNNAGTGSAEPLLGMDYRRWRSVIAVDLDGAFLCAQRAARRMVDAGGGGRIVNVTSMHEEYPRVGAGAYCAAKGGLRMVSRVLALELAGHGITVNAVAPGEIATPMTGQEDRSPQDGSRPGRVTPVRWPRRWPSSPGRPRRTSRGRRCSSTEGSG